MTYAEAVAHLYGLGPELASAPPAPPADPEARGAAGAASTPPRRKFDLAHMRTLMAALGDPQDRVPSVLIAGTNGKGSTAATLASILAAAGYRVGLYTSPHLARVNERFQLARPTLPGEYGSARVRNADGPLTLAEIADADFARLYAKVDEVSSRLVDQEALPWGPSFFERLTAVCFLYFAGSEHLLPAEIMVLEVGLGGRLDATNIVSPLLSILTDISYDHQEYLGETLTEIAGEKCGILRERGTMITLSQHPETNQAIGEAAIRLGVRAIDAARYLPPAQRNQDQVPPAQYGAEKLARNRYTIPLDSSLLEIDSPLAGEHQQRNLALAVAAAIELSRNHGFAIAESALAAGIRATCWPGRLEWIEPNVLLDVAHNPAGAWTLRAALAGLAPDRPRTLIFSCLRDKSLQEMSRILFPLFDSSEDADPLRRGDHIILAPIANPRAAAVADLQAAAQALGVPAHAAPHLAGAFKQALEITPAGGVIVATGSVYLVGEIRSLALESRGA